MYRGMMRASILSLALLAVPAQAQQAAPTAIGTFQDWQAATFTEGGNKVCYAFTRAGRSQPNVPNRGEVVLTVTHRPGSRDQVAVRAGYTYPAGAEPSGMVEASAGNVSLAFFTAGDAAFARNRAEAIQGFQRGRTFRLQGPGPRGGTVTDTFSLMGFSAAYRAISDACR
jgi:hypothetical protein